MMFLERKIESQISRALQRGKSILLLGPRQTGKTTLIKKRLTPTLSFNFAHASTRIRYQKDPTLFEKELSLECARRSDRPLIFVDEVQKIPGVMDTIQVMIDEGKAQFILSGSSARKLKHGEELNLLPGRVVRFTLSPLVYEELSIPQPSIENLLIYGSLPHILTTQDAEDRERDLFSYVSTYVEDEIRAEAAVRNAGQFSQFLEFAAGESGKQINFSRISQDIGVSHTTIAHYFEILYDTLLAIRINPLTKATSKRRLIQSPRYLFFDLGVRRACANEGIRLPKTLVGDLFEQFVGLELWRYAHLHSERIKIRYWRDSNGPEVDYVLDMGGNYLPVEVKWNEAPTAKDARHIETFLDEYPTGGRGWIVCRTPRPYRLTKRVDALPWQDIGPSLAAQLD